MLKLDFKKKYDMVDWECLLEVLGFRGFDLKWIKWINLCLNSAETHIMINGTPIKRLFIKEGREIHYHHRYLYL